MSAKNRIVKYSIVKVAILYFFVSQRAVDLKLLIMFNLRNTMLSLIVTGVAIVAFGIFYAIVYRITSNAYYSIVSGKKERT